MQIIIDDSGFPTKYTCHEHELLLISGFVQEYRKTHQDELITLRPREKVPDISATTINQFIHWLYNNCFTTAEGIDFHFNDLLNMYFFANAYAITVLKNVVIDHLIDKCRSSRINSEQTQRIYKHTQENDQLRRLWVDFYIWEVPESQLNRERKSKALDSFFLEDLTLARMQRIRKLHKTLISATPPYERLKSAYHKRDEYTGICCRRKQFEGEGYYHRDDYHQETASLKNKLERLHSKLEALKRQESEKSRLKRKIPKLQLKLKRAEVKVKEHRSVGVRKLWKEKNWDHLDYPELGNTDACRLQY